MDNVKLTTRQSKFTSLKKRKKNIYSSVVTTKYLNPNKVKGTRMSRQNKSSKPKKITTSERLDSLGNLLEKI